MVHIGTPLTGWERIEGFAMRFFHHRSIFYQHFMIRENCRKRMDADKYAVTEGQNDTLVEIVMQISLV